MPDIFQRKRLETRKPIVADMCTILWDNITLTTATQIQLSYSQQVTRRRTLGGNNGANVAVIYPSQPIGQLLIQRLVAENTEDQALFDQNGWSACKPPATITVSLNGQSSYEDCNTQGGVYTCIGAIVSSFGISAEAESLTVVDNVNVEFLQLEFEQAS